MRRILVLIFFVSILGLGIYFYWGDQVFKNGGEIISPLGKVEKQPGSLEKYSFEILQKRDYQGSQVKFERTLKNEQQFTSYLFSYQSQGKKVTGMADIPLRLPFDFAQDKRSGQAKFPVIVMIRGYVDDKIYRTGMGTEKPAEFFASNGFITLAPDFLGYGESDDTYPDILEDRFVRPVTVLDLMASIKTLKQADPNKVAIWGHSNGGQIVLSVLEISKQPIPTTLWAPVTKGFPESVLTYMSQLDDLGVKVKQRIDDFVKDYDASKFSITNYFADIQAPLQVHQGTGDEYIETEWTDEFVSKMKSLGQSVAYYKYTGDNHNLSTNWDTVVSRDLEFFRKNLGL